MKNKVVLIVAVLFGLLAAFLTRTYLATKNDEFKKLTDRFNATHGTIDVLCFKKDVPGGTVVAKPDLILINPALVDFSKRNSFKSAFQGSPQTPLVALVYTYFDQQWLKHFDAVIEINDEPQKIIDKITEVLQNSSDKTESSDLYELSDRERDVLIELSKGQTNKEIAEKLHISVHTVITHRKNIVRKTGIKSAAGLAVYAMLNNLIES